METYFWSNQSKEDSDKIDAYANEYFFTKMAEFIAELINKNQNGNSKG